MCLLKVIYAKAVRCRVETDMSEIIQPPQPDRPLLEVVSEHALWKERAAYAIAHERKLRAQIIERLFPDPKEGTNKVEEDNIKFTLKHPIDRKVEPGVLEALKAQVTAATAAGQDHPLAHTNFDALIRSKPELALREYKSLTDAEKAVFDACLVIKPGSDQLEYKALPTA